MGSLSIWHWIVVIAVVLLLFGRGKISDLMGDVAQGIKSFKKGLQDDDKTAEKPAEPVKTIDHNARAVHGGAHGCRQQGCLSTSRQTGRALTWRRGAAGPVEEDAGGLQILLASIGAISPRASGSFHVRHRVE